MNGAIRSGRLAEIDELSSGKSANFVPSCFGTSRTPFVNGAGSLDRGTRPTPSKRFRVRELPGAGPTSALALNPGCANAAYRRRAVADRRLVPFADPTCTLSIEILAESGKIDVRPLSSRTGFDNLSRCTANTWNFGQNRCSEARRNRKYLCQFIP